MSPTHQHPQPLHRLSSSSLTVGLQLSSDAATVGRLIPLQRLTLPVQPSLSDHQRSGRPHTTLMVHLPAPHGLRAALQPHCARYGGGGTITITCPRLQWRSVRQFRPPAAPFRAVPAPLHVRSSRVHVHVSYCTVAQPDARVRKRNPGTQKNVDAVLRRPL